MSTTDQLAAAVGAPSAPVGKPKTKAQIIVEQVLSDQFKQKLALALPKHLSADRMVRIAATEIRKNPALLNTTPASFLGAVMQSAQLGLEPGSALGQAYLVPYGNQCQLILGYRGMIDLARRSGQVLSLSAFAVHDGDEFNYQLGLHPDIHHVPSVEADRIKKTITFVYAVANLRGGGYQFEVMSRAEVEAVKAKAKSKNIWNNYFEQMALKGLSLDTRIPTPTGWTTMKDIKVGDKVFDMYGHETLVEAVSEVKLLPCYKVTFSNGCSVICDEEHRWVARKGNQNAHRLPYQPLTVKELYEAKLDGLRITIPVQKPIELQEQALPIDPYILGYWLGDGTSRSAEITCWKEDLPHVTRSIQKSSYALGTIRAEKRNESVRVGIIKGLNKALRENKLICNKHVPASYLRSSIEQRKQLLAGLLDSDGSCDKKRGRVIFTSKNIKLCDAVFELACSLGENPHRRDFTAVLCMHGNRKEHPAHSVEWKPSFNPFTLERKAKNYQPRKIAPYLSIKSIEKVESVPTKCIAVSSMSKTYLCGEGMSVTHNTVIRRLFKYLPVSIEALQVANVDAKREAGEEIKPEDVFDINAVSVDDFKDIEEGEIVQEQPTTEKSSDVQQ